MQCEVFQRQLDALIDDELTPEAESAARGHMSQCLDCNECYQQSLQLRQALRTLTVPPPPVGFEQRVVARTLACRSRESGYGWKGMMAAGLVMFMVFGGYLRWHGMVQQEESVIPVALETSETWTIQLVFNSKQTLENVTLTLILPEGLEVAGFPAQRRIGWETHLLEGSNTLRLPLVRLANGSLEAELIAELEHPSGSKRFQIHPQWHVVGAG